jgi:hypothetical protein
MLFIEYKLIISNINTYLFIKRVVYLVICPNKNLEQTALNNFIDYSILATACKRTLRPADKVDTLFSRVFNYSLAAFTCLPCVKLFTK